MGTAFRDDIFMITEREVTILETEHFGKLAYVEVGPCVGKIKQTHHQETFNRGDEKGCFWWLHRDCTGEPGKWALMSEFYLIPMMG